MTAHDQDLEHLRYIAEIITKDGDSPASKIEELYRYLFRTRENRNHALAFSSPTEWEPEVFNEAIAMIEEIVTHYVQQFPDTRTLPVPYRKRQKLSAIHLDQLLSKVLQEGWNRLHSHSTDPQSPFNVFFQTPILYLKQVAQSKGFPRSKKGGRASLRALIERFESEFNSEVSEQGRLSSTG